MNSTPTLAAFFDELARYAECWCPDSYKDNGIEAEDCPKHLAQRGYSMTLDNGETVPIPQALFPMDNIGGFLTGWPDETPRAAIAAVLWRITAEFVHDEAPLRIPAGSNITDTAEEYVRRNADEAEGETLWMPSHSPSNRIISEMLHELGLLDDYMRVKTSTQHMAFADADSDGGES